MDDLNEALENLFAKDNDFLTAKMRDRPYDGQPQTPHGERGEQEVFGITMRDVRDCFVIGAFQAAGFHFEHTEDYSTIYTGTIYELPWEEMAPGAVIRNAICEIESRMGIYPNLPGKEKRERED